MKESPEITVIFSLMVSSTIASILVSQSSIQLFPRRHSLKYFGIK
jgi:hypothetical protein